MNVFVLCTGRCGSVTFVRAAQHITNYSSGHETRALLTGPDRLAYPTNHIEADNRLSWLLGRLDQAYGDRAFYVHLTRDPEAVARSFEKRWATGIIRAYHEGILKAAQKKKIEVCRDYVETVTENILEFLSDKPHKLHFALESADQHWTEFWESIGAKGDFEASVREWSIAHNARSNRPSSIRRFAFGLKRTLRDH